MDKRKYEITLTVLSILTVLMTAVGVTFAYFYITISGDPKEASLTTATIGGVIFDGGADFEASSEIEPGWSGTKTFKITVAPSDIEQTVNVKMDYTNGFTDLIGNVSSVEDGAIGDINLVTDAENVTTVTLVSKTFPPSTETRVFTYTLSMEFPNLDKNQNYDQGQSFNATLYAAFGDANIYYNAENPNGTDIEPK